MITSFRLKKGFTLIEVLLVVMLLGMLGTAAVSVYVNSVSTFGYLGKYKSFMSSLRATRSYALTDRGAEDLAVSRYGAHIGYGSIVVFADDGVDDDFGPNDYRFVFEEDGADTIIPLKTYSSDVYGEDFDDIKITAYGADSIELHMPVTLFYELGTTNVVMYQGDNLLNDNFITLKFDDLDSTREKYVVIFKVAGLPEEYGALP